MANPWSKRLMAGMCAGALLFGPLFVASAGAQTDSDGDGVPDEDLTDNPMATGSGGNLPSPLPLETTADVIAILYQLMPDLDADGFPDFPRNADGTPDFAGLNSFIGEPGDRDLRTGPDDQIDQEFLEAEDLNNIQITMADGTEVFVATTESAQHALQQVQAAGGDLGQVAGSGSALSGPCYGITFSYDSNGDPLDMAFDFSDATPPFTSTPGGDYEQAFTSGNPFRVDVDGAVIYTGIAGGVPPGSGPMEHDWFIEMNFLGFDGTNVDAGGDPNTAGENRNAGSVSLLEDLPGPAKINGLMAINGQMMAPVPADFFCVGSGFVEFEGGLDPTLPGAALVLLSTVGLLFNARPALTWGGAE